MNEFYKLSTDKVMEQLGVTENGLEDAEIVTRRKEQGFNELEDKGKKGPLRIFLEQFKDFLVLILIAAAGISIFLGKFESALVIIVVVIINGILGTIQHFKAEQSLQSLKSLSSPNAKVLRNGQKVEIPSRELLVGDIFYLDAGDYVSADGRILEIHSLQTDESSLTGESVSVPKNTDIVNGDHVAIGDRKNMVFSGSFVTSGRAVVVATAIGMNTEIGKIASLLKNAQEKKTPLQVSLDDFGKKLAVLILVLSGLIFLLNISRGQNQIEALLFAVSLAVAAIPEALSSIVTIVLAIGTQKLARQNAIVRKLHAVEGLGSVSVICSDKTGTLTQNKMKVKRVFVDGRVSDDCELDPTKWLEKKLIQAALLCNDAITAKDKEIGDPTEIALVNLGEIYGLDEERLRKDYPRLGEIPFDSDRKLMSTVHRLDNSLTMFTKGALDVMLSRVVSIQKAGGVEELTQDAKKHIEQVNREFSESGLRVLALAYKELRDDEETDIGLEDEKELIFIGLIAMMDPPREESAPAIASAQNAGIKPVMITGDHKITASAIARQIGILKEEREALEGYELDKLSDDALRERVETISVYARVSPEHKIRIVRAWQDRGNVVAMTGDGVNDAPALKQADIGIAMGITGTEVAKDAASMVLTDDNFSTIIRAVSYGRSIFSNIKNSIRFLLSGNTAGILTVVYASVFALPVPFAPVHLLFINLVTDSLPAIAIGLEPYNDKVMTEKPRSKEAPILDRSFGLGVLAEGIVIALSTVIAFHIGLATGDTTLAATMAFATLGISRLFHGFNSRSKESIFRVGIFTNKTLWQSVIAGFLLIVMVVTLKPLESIFEVSVLNMGQLSTVIGLALIPLVVIQIYKLLAVHKH